MRVFKIVFNEDTFGITQRSLKMLRNTLALTINHPIVVVCVPVNDLCCGFFVFDRKTKTAYFSGDGFRLDQAGEGGAGYRSASALFDIYGINAIMWEPIPLEEIYNLPEDKLEQKLMEVANSIATGLSEKDFRTPFKQKPHYVRRY